jgi:cobalt/nickel transport system ATP-binding protein
VRVDGQPVSDANVGAIRAAVGLVFQNPDDQLFSPSVIEDVAFGPLHMGLPPADVHDRAIRALERVGMGGYENRLSYHLSTGEKKRIAIATVLSMDAQILALDEPTAGLDPRARRTLLRLLGDLPVGMLVSTHDLRMARELLPRMIVLDEGRIVADGPTERLLADTALLEAHGLELD